MRRRFKLEYVNLFPEIKAIFGYIENGIHENEEGYEGIRTIVTPDDA